MIAVGDVVDAVVRRIENYGVYLEAGGANILVLITELADWRGVRHPSVVVWPGEVVRVLIERYNDQDGIFVGSMKPLAPDTSPYERLRGTPPGTLVRATVHTVYRRGGAVVVMECGLWVNLSPEGMPEGLRPGDVIEAVIEDVDVERGRVILRASSGGRAGNASRGVPAEIKAHRKPLGGGG